MLLIRVATVLFLISALSPPAIAEERAVLLDANESPPYWSATMPKDGMCGEIVHAASEAAGVASEIQYKPLSRMIEDDSNNDLGNPAFYMSNQDFAAIIPVCVYHVGLYYYRPNHKRDIDVKRVEDLKGYRIGILKGTLVDRFAFERAGVTFEESYTQESLFKKLQRGRIDLVLEIDLVGQKIIERLFPDHLDNFVSSIIKNSHMPIAILIDGDYPDAKTIGDLYRKGMREIKESGLYVRILERYYGVGKVPDEMLSDLKRFEMIYGFNGAE